MGKERGYLLYDEVNDILPEGICSSDELDSIFSLFGSAGIEVIDSEQKFQDEGKKDDKRGEDSGEEGEFDLAAISLDKTNDPVRMYLREMGTVPLLSREGEVEIAKRIEHGQKVVLKAISRSPLVVRELLIIGDKLKKSLIPIRDVVALNDDELTDVRLEEAKTVKKQVRALEARLKEVEQEAFATVPELKRTLATIKAGELEADIAKKELVEANLRLVVSIAKKYTNRGLQFLDLIQEGNIGLMKAVDKFEYKRGYKFSTYATWWIRQAITRAIADQARTIRIPVHMIETINKLIRTSRHLVQKLGREPSPEEIAEKMDLPLDKVRKILKIAKEPISLETPIGEEEDSHLGDFIEDKKAISPLDAAIRYDLQRQINNALKTLTPREERVLRKRFGIGENTDHTLEEVGQDFAVTRERIRQIEAKALRKLRHPSRSKKLRSFVESL